MPYDHCNIPEIEILIKQSIDLGLNKFVKRYSKYDYLIGDSDAIVFVHQKIKLWNEIKSE